jgi:hypothetical protein
VIDAPAELVNFNFYVPAPLSDDVGTSIVAVPLPRADV